MPVNHLDRLVTGSDTDVITAGLCNADPITKQGKRIQMVQMLVFPLLPLVFLFVECSISLKTTLVQIHTDDTVRSQVDKMMDLAKLLDGTQRERTQVLHYVISQRVNRSQFVSAVEYTDSVLQGLSQWPVTGGTSEISSLLHSKNVFIHHLSALRNSVIKNESETVEDSSTVRDNLFDQTLDFYNTVDEQISDSFVSMLRHVTGQVWKHLMALESVLKLRESFDIEMVVAEFYFVHGYLGEDHYNTFLKHYSLGKDAAATLRLYSETAQKVLSEYHMVHLDVVDYINEKQELVMRRSLNGQQNPDMAKEWIQKTEEYEELTIYLWHRLETETRQYLDDSKSRSIAEESVAIAIMCFVICLSPALLTSTWRLASTIQKYALNLTNNARERRREKKRSDMLLYQMLPKSVALQLKMSRRVAAESYTAVSIYFSDIVGFTKLSARSTPMQVVDFLNKLYFFFDDVLSKYDVYKVETIGDAYMVTSGVPQRNGKRHAGEVGTMALQIVDGIQNFSIPHMPLEQPKIRIGIHTGSVVAGVVGTKMPRYCLFGETVGLASCMESTGIPMKIQLSAATKGALDQLGGFVMERRGTIEIKGVCHDTWFLIGCHTSRVTSKMSSHVFGSMQSDRRRSTLDIFTTPEVGSALSTR